MTEIKERLMSISEAAAFCHLTRQAIFVAIRKGRLKAVKGKKEWRLSEKDLEEYRCQKYNRDYSIFNGSPLYDMDKKELSIKKAAKLLGISDQRLYYLARIGRLPHEKRGASIVVGYEEVIKVIKEEGKDDSSQLQSVG